MLILGIDSSTKYLNITLNDGHASHYGIRFSREKGFMVNIISCIDMVFRKAGKSISDVDLFSVNIGPGDFTGTRIGLSVAKMLSFVREKPLYGISATDVCAVQLLADSCVKINRLLKSNESVLLLPVLDVKRNEILFSIYEASLAESANPVFMYTIGESNIFLNKISADNLIDFEEFAGELDRKFLFEAVITAPGSKPIVFASGTAFHEYKELFSDIKKLNYGFYLDKKAFYPDALYLNLCALYRDANKSKNHLQQQVLDTREPLLDVQILAPMKKGVLGVYNITAKLQAALNPPSPHKSEHISGDSVFREGDRVMQMKNNYKIEWRKKTANGGVEDGTGAFNGDLGTIYQIHESDRSLSVIFDDERLAVFDYTHIDELELAYCISIHKSQGSEFPIVILPMFGAASQMMTRNLLYTAVTRAKRQVVCIGRRDALMSMVNNNRTDRRYTALCNRLSELKGLGV